LATNTTTSPKPVDLFAEVSTNINYNWLKQAESERAKLAKEEINSWYKKCESYLDGKHFIKEFPKLGKFHARWWELFLCNYLLERNFKLEKNKAGRADFCFTLPCGKRVEIEAVACSDGEFCEKKTFSIKCQR
jgi:hypothetical protein